MQLIQVLRELRVINLKVINLNTKYLNSLLLKKVTCFFQHEPCLYPIFRSKTLKGYLRVISIPQLINLQTTTPAGALQIN